MFDGIGVGFDAHVSHRVVKQCLQECRKSLSRLAQQGLDGELSVFHGPAVDALLGTSPLQHRRAGKFLAK